MLRNRANDSLLKVITETNIENKQFGKVDDYISLLKDEAAKKGIGPEEMDKLALKVAVMDNILSQAAVDYLSKHTDGDLKALLSNTDIYKSDLKTWTDLQTYVNKQTDGKITPEELNRIAAAVLAETDPSIGILKRQILTFSENSPAGDLIRQIVASLDQSNIRTKEQWLQEFYSTAVDRGLTQQQISELLVKISSSPDTKVEEYLRDLIAQSDEPLASMLKSIDLKKENIKTPEELITYLFANKDKYPLEALSKSIAKLIAAKNLSVEGLKSQSSGAGRGNLLWILGIILGAGILGLIFFLLLRKRKKNK
jgi:hypothetical protein